LKALEAKYKASSSSSTKKVSSNVNPASSRRLRTHEEVKEINRKRQARRRLKLKLMKDGIPPKEVGFIILI